MKKVKITYWICTGLITALLGVGAIFDAISAPEAVAHITHLGYPAYLVPFLGVAKMAALAVILVPGFRRLKEWAYAGLVIDLVGAFYSHVAVGDGPEMWAGFIPMLAVLGISYAFSHKLHRAAQGAPERTPAERYGQVSLSGN
jgi:hypothetical protein